MGMKLKIRITQEIIDRAACRSVSSCAFALTIREIFPDAMVGLQRTTFVASSDIYVRRKTTVNNSEEVRDFIGWFDNFSGMAGERKLPDGQRYKDFEIDIPDAMLDVINIDEIKRVLEGHATLQIAE